MIVMKLNFNWKNDGKWHQYCMNCHAETVERVYENNKTFYFCDSCEQKQDRSIIIDPAIKWWTVDNGEYWHESSGIFVRNADKKFLFFERLIFPFALTVPSGHVDAGEDSFSAAIRETKEEIGYDAENLLHIATEDIVGDSCSRGADIHRWHAYLLPLQTNINVEVTEKDEGQKPVWLTLEEAMKKELTYPVKYIIDKYQDELVA